jgi:hypothetical protein
MGLLSWFSALAPSAAEIRAEVWKLGVRHHGEPLEGALRELKEASLAPTRAALLKACVAQLKRG